METLAPLFEICVDLRFALERGESLRQPLDAFSSGRKDELSEQIKSFLVHTSQNRPWPNETVERLSYFRQCFFDILARGFAGEPIHKALCHFEEDLRIHCEGQIQSFIRKLPYKVLMPILLFQLPAYLILFFGPALQDLVHQLQQ